MTQKTLDINTAHDLLIKIDLDKDTDVVFSGFDSLDTGYSLTLTKEKQPDKSHTFVVDTDITLDGGAKTVTLTIDGSDYERGTYKGVLESDNPEAAVFYRCNITMKVI